MLLDAEGQFVGRESQLAQLRSAFDGGARVAVVVGTFGVGKTRLAAEFAARWPGEFVMTCALEDVCDAEQLDLALSQTATTSLDLIGEFDRASLLRQLASVERPLVVLDAAEGAIDAVAELLAQARDGASEVRWLVTSRIASSQMPRDVVELELSPLDPQGALDLFRQRLPRVAREAMGDDFLESETVRRIVDQLDRLPLAIELAAARCAVLSFEQLSDRLEQKRLSLLKGSAIEPGTSTSVRQALSVSYEMLDEACRRGLCRWSVFRGGFTLEAADCVADPAAGTDEPATLEILEELVAHSLVYRLPDAEDVPPRFSMLESVRDFAREAAQAEQIEAAKRLHAEYFKAMAERVLAGRRVEAHDFRQMLAEADNFEALFENAVDTGRTSAAYHSLRVLLYLISRTQGPTTRLASLFRQADEADIFAGYPEELAVLSYRRGKLALDTNQLDLAARLFRQAEAAAAEAGLDGMLASAERGLGYVRMLRGSLDAAEEHFERALEYARRANDRLQQSFILCGKCNIEWYRCRFGDALEDAEAALALIEAESDVPTESLAGVHNTIGTTLGMLGMWTRAGFHLDRSVEYYRASNDRVSEVSARLNRAVLYAYSNGDNDEARAELQEVYELAMAFYQEQRAAQALVELAVVELEEGLYEAVMQHLQVCRELVNHDDFARGAALRETLDCVEVWCLALRGDLEEARRGLAKLRASRERLTEQTLSVLELTGVLVDVAALLHATAPAPVDVEATRQAADPYRIGEQFAGDEPPGFDWVLRRILTTNVGRMGGGDAQHVLRVEPQARQVEWEGEVIDLSRRGPMRRILVTLLDAAGAGPVDVHELLEAGWPDQKIELESGLSRVYTTLRRLRDLGLRDVVLTVDDGYCIEPSVEVEWVGALGC